MTKQINDINKLSNEEIQRNREVVLEYLREVENSAKTPPSTTPKESEKSDLSISAPNLIDGLLGGKERRNKAPEIAKAQIRAVAPPIEKKVQPPVADIVAERKPAAAPPQPPVMAKPKPVVKKIEEKKLAKPGMFKRFLGLAVSTAKPAPKPESAPQKKPAEARPKISPQIKATFFDFIEGKKQPEQPADKKIGALTKPVSRHKMRWLPVWLLFILSLVYLCFCLTVYIFSLDSPSVKKIASLLPVPAMLTTVGNVDYYEYLDEKRAFMAVMKLDEPLDREELALLRETIIKEKIISRLGSYYGFIRADSPHLPDSELKNKLAIAVVTDPQINQLALTKTRKFVKEMKKNLDFDQTATAFSLPVSIEYFPTVNLEKIFNKKIAGLGGFEDIQYIAKADGFYALQFYNKTSELTGVKYIFIRAKTLDSFVADEISKVKAIILAR